MSDIRDQGEAAREESDQNHQGTASSASPMPFGSGLVTILSTLSVATLLSLLVGLCYFYNRAYRLAYFGPLGLDPNAIPITVQDAIVDGFLGINQHVLWLLFIFTIIVLVYVTAIWFSSRYLEKLAIKLGIRSRQPVPSAALVEFGKSSGFRTSFLTSVVALAMTIVSGTALFLVGLPADHAGRRHAEALRAEVKSSKGRCNRYVLTGKIEIVGQNIGNSAERLFVLGNDDALHIVKFDEIDELQQTQVACRRVSVSEPEKARQPKLPG